MTGCVAGDWGLVFGFGEGGGGGRKEEEGTGGGGWDGVGAVLS